MGDRPEAGRLGRAGRVRDVPALRDRPLAELVVPRPIAETVGDELVDALERDLGIGERTHVGKRGDYGLDEGVAGDRYVGDEVVVVAGVAIFGLPRRGAQAPADEREVEFVEQRAVVEQVCALHTQAVAGKLTQRARAGSGEQGAGSLS